MAKPHDSKVRKERDSFGLIDVPADKLWGAQTQRSLQHFAISTEHFPPALIYALVEVKRASAKVNADLGLLDTSVAAAIIAAADEVLAGHHADAFPLSVWQTGSGTQTHMNVNEVLANRASELLGGERGMARRVHPNDQVNLGQSSNDIFPTAMHVAAAIIVNGQLLPNLQKLRQGLHSKAQDFDQIVKLGRTHLQDATPITLGQEFSGFVAQLDIASAAISSALPPVMQLAVGGTAVGTGLNTHPEFGARVAQALCQRFPLNWVSADNKFAALAGHEALLNLHGTLKTLAAALLKIANDIRWLASGPRAGLGELSLPENEPGSSIMPGKNNPTQCEALAMVCCQVFGNDVAITIGGASGHFELNTFKPLIAHNFLQSARLLSDAMASFETHCIKGLSANHERITALLNQSLMLVTALTPHIGYDKSAEIAHLAHHENLSLKEAALRLEYVSAADFELWVRPERMVSPQT